MTAEKGKFTLQEFLQYLLQTTARVIEDTAEIEKKDFLAEGLHGRRLRDAVVLNLGHMGETANDIGTHFPEFLSQNPDIPIRKISDMRNQLFHGYHAINYELVWTTSRTNVPIFRAQVEAALELLGVPSAQIDDGLSRGP